MEKNLSRKLIKLELELVSPSTRASAERLDELIADDFEEFGSSGKVIHKQDLLDARGPVVEYELSGFSVKRLSATVALVTYVASHLGRRSYRSSIWVEAGGTWRMLHHQSTPVSSDP